MVSRISVDWIWDMVTLSFELMGMMDFAGRNNRQAGAAHFRGNGRWQQKTNIRPHHRDCEC